VACTYNGEPDGTRTRNPQIDSLDSDVSEEVAENEDVTCCGSGSADCSAFVGQRSPELAMICDAWDGLPDVVKRGILAMVEAARGGA